MMFDLFLALIALGRKTSKAAINSIQFDNDDKLSHWGESD